MKEKLTELTRLWVAHHAKAMASDLIANGVVVVVRCGDCAKRKLNPKTGLYKCDNCRYKCNDDDWFCPDGERRET